MLYLLLAVIIFIIVDFAIRYFLKQVQEKKELKKRAEILDNDVLLNYSNITLSLKRAEVKNPKAKILCVDDEDIILDSFRKILVLDGYSVDTVTRGREALTLVRNHHYDFVFTDLKMPEMDGVEVTKSIKHLRPDIDVVIITGFATVDTAVECMKLGALDYVQKPFSEDELLKFASELVLKRQENLKARLNQRVQITSEDLSEKIQSYQLLIPGGVFISENHCWLNLLQDGTAKIGIDDFAMRLIHHFDEIEFPIEGATVKYEQPLFIVKQGQKNIPFRTPLSGIVRKINTRLKNDLESLEETPYKNNWICIVEPTNFDEELKNLKIGKSAIEFYNLELDIVDKYAKDNFKGIFPESLEALNFTDVEKKKYDRLIEEVLIKE